MYRVAELEAALAGSMFAGKLHYAAETGSTNSDALEAGGAGAPHGSVFLADAQRAGRGRGDHAWQSAGGEGLYVSVLLRPALAAARLPLLPLAAGLAAAEAIRSASGLAVDLRWPNDLLLGERKAGGILVEARTEGSAVAFAVVGIGINAHQRSFDAALNTPATSLDLEAARRIGRGALLAVLLKSLERELAALARPAAAEAVLRRVEAASTWLRGRQVEVHGPQACTGVTDGLDANGFLRVKTTAGMVTVQTGGIRATDGDSHFASGC